MRTNTRLFSIISLIFAAASCAEVSDEQPTGKDETNMALDTVIIPQVGDPNSLVPGHPASKVYAIKSGTTTGKPDIDSNNTTLEKQVFGLNDKKVDRAGDTGLTNDFAINPGTLSITGSAPDVALTVNAAPGETAVEVLGDTNITAMSVTSPAGIAIAAFGGGTNAAVTAQGGMSGPGLIAQSGTTSLAAAPTEAARFAGYLRITAPNPNVGVDPGANGAVYAGSVARARGRVYLGGAPPFSFVGGKALNFVSLVAVVGLGTTRVTMVRPMADTNYEVHLSVHGGTPYSVSETNIPGRTTTQFEFTVFNTTSGTPGVGSAEYVDIAVFGEQ